MKISKIEFENFRNFKEHGEIRCSTDGKVTIIYGKNGDGKTTLHQLFQWVFYGQVHFNKTTSDRLYNLGFESEQSFGSTFDVMGRIDFEHEDHLYSLTRTYTYKKGLDDSEKIAEDLSLNQMDDDNNWKRLDNPKDTIEKLLPSGLSDYFFFDGESMIADLRVKGKDAAGKLKKALYSMFDLDVVESALNHIGRTDLKTTVLGKLYISKAGVSTGGTIAAVKTNIENAQTKIDSFKDKIESSKKEKEAKQQLINKVSEQIGNTKSRTEYERQRKLLKNQRDTFLKNALLDEATFGDAVMDMFPHLIISKAVEDARKKIKLKINNNKLPTGISKALISYLLKESTSECICGNPLCEKELEHIKAYLEMLPPKSPTMLYNDFVKTAKSWGKGYDKEKIEEFIKLVLDNNENAAQCDIQIKELDETEKKSPDIEDLIIARQQAENDVRRLDEDLSLMETEKRKFEIYLKKQMETLDELTSKIEAVQIISHKIEIMEEVRSYFANKLDEESISYSARLEENIQNLIDLMLTSKRNVSVSKEFSVVVADSYNNESKSEGQFAVVSFAYIGGILKMLKSEEHLSSKEYPLVLDGPFSKLDADQRQNVVNAIPSFAPQVILFSKDDLENVFDKNAVGRIWTIESNEEKNVATVQEGHLWK